MSNAKHPLVTLGDSLTQGFMSGAIHRTDISYPAILAGALGARDRFAVPETFTGEGGLPLNLERVVRRLGESFGSRIQWWELLPAAVVSREILDDVEDYWERGRGSRPFGRHQTYHNLGVWGFEVRDAYTVSEGVVRQALPQPRDNLISQVPEMSMYRTARQVLNPDFGPGQSHFTQIDRAVELGRDGGIGNLVAAYGANNALGTVLTLKIFDSVSSDLTRPRHERTSNLYRPEHFEILYRELADRLAEIDAENVFLGTVPHITIPPVTRGVSPGKTGAKALDRDGYFQFYTRPWIWDDDFDPGRDPHLTRAEARRIDRTIDAYNKTIRTVAKQRGWHVVEISKLLDDLAYRRHSGRPPFAYPPGLLKALRATPRLKYLVAKDGSVRLDTRFLIADRRSGKKGRLFRGGLISLDGIHPTTITYGLAADMVLDKMKDVGAAPANAVVDWRAVVAADTLVNQPPPLIEDLQSALGCLERFGLLDGVFDEFT